MCHKFKKFTVQERVDFVFQNKMCNNCLSPGHIKSKCPSKNTCFICKMNHHTLLHMVKQQNFSNSSQNPKFFTNHSNRMKTESHESVENSPSLPSTSKKTQNPQVQANVSVNSDCILLRTALVHIEHMGELFPVRALIDPGSQRTFLSEKIRNRLQMPSRKSHIEIVGIGGQIQSSTKECDLVIFSKRLNFKFSISAIVLPKVTKHIPSTSFAVSNSADLSELDLADPWLN